MVVLWGFSNFTYRFYLKYSESVQVAEWFALPTSEHKVPGLHPARSGTQLVSKKLHCTKLFIITLPSSQYDLNNVEREVNYQTISSLSI